MGGHESDDPLGLDSQTMRELGYRTVDLLVERLERERGGPPLRRATPTEMGGRLHGPPLELPEPFNEILQRVDREMLPFASRDGHPRFFGFVPFAGTWPGALGDLIASGSNLYAGSWMESAGPSQVELEVLGWFKDWIGYPPDAAGSLSAVARRGTSRRSAVRARRSRGRCATTSSSTSPTRRTPRSPALRLDIRRAGHARSAAGANCGR